MAVDSGSSSGSLTAKWKKIAEHETLKRSSHSVAAVTGDEGQLFVFGGELVARQPRDGHVHVLHAGVSALFLCEKDNGIGKSGNRHG